jgi:DHA2 family multidrug resistance protein-like MFS transporter
VPADAAAVARDTLGGAMGIAEQLPTQLSSAVLDTARAAFVEGMQVTSAISAVVAIVVAVVAVAMLRNIRSDADPGESAGPDADLAVEREGARQEGFAAVAEA